MEFLTTLWLPILLSAVFVFILSSVIHMFLGYHANDLQKVPDEERTLDALRQLDIPPGTYGMPKADSMSEFRSPEHQAKVNRGPVVHMTIREPGKGMGKSLVQWFIYCIVVGVFSAYIGMHAAGTEASYLDVFRFVGCAAFMGYSLALFQDPIWMSQNWGATMRSAFDGLIYALVTAGTFGWLWAY